MGHDKIFTKYVFVFNNIFAFSFTISSNFGTTSHFPFRYNVGSLRVCITLNDAAEGHHVKVIGSGPAAYRGTNTV